MPLAQPADPTTLRSTFTKAIVVTALLTYLIAALLILFVERKNAKANFKKYMTLRFKGQILRQSVTNVDKTRKGKGLDNSCRNEKRHKNGSRARFTWSNISGRREQSAWSQSSPGKVV